MIRDIVFDHKNKWTALYKITNSTPFVFEIKSSSLSSIPDITNVGVGLHTWGYVIINNDSLDVLTLPKEVIQSMLRNEIVIDFVNVIEVMTNVTELAPSDKDIDYYLQDRFIPSPVPVFIIDHALKNENGTVLGYMISVKRNVSLSSPNALISKKQFDMLNNLKFIDNTRSSLSSRTVEDDFFKDGRGEPMYRVRDEMIAANNSDAVKFIRHITSLIKENTTKDKSAIKPVEKSVVKKRPTWEEYFMASAELMSSRSTCDRLFVGAVLVQDNHIVAEGYNGSIAGHEHCESDNHLMYENGCKRTIHAEMNVITTCAKLGIPTKGGTVYVTHQPCPDCTKHLNQSGIKEIVYKHPYKHRYENNFDDGMILRQYIGRNVNINWD